MTFLVLMKNQVLPTDGHISKCNDTVRESMRPKDIRLPKVAVAMGHEVRYRVREKMFHFKALNCKNLHNSKETKLLPRQPFSSNKFLKMLVNPYALFLWKGISFRSLIRLITFTVLVVVLYGTIKTQKIHRGISSMSLKAKSPTEFSHSAGLINSPEDFRLVKKNSHLREFKKS